MSALLDLPGLRYGVAALRSPRGVLYQDALRWRILLAPAGANPEGVQKWLAAQGLLEGAEVPKAAVRINQVFLVPRGDAPDVPFQIAPGARFSCACCGNSCRGMDLGPLLPADVERLVALDWKGSGRDPARFFVTRDGEPASAADVGRGGLFLRHEGDACQFLGADNLCQVHARFGAAAKPQMCRAFPIEFRVGPTGVRVGLRMGECLSAEEARGGEPVRDTPELRALYDELPRVPLVPPLLWLTRDALATEGEVDQIEAAALAASRPERGGLPTLLDLIDRLVAHAKAPAAIPAPLAALEPLEAASRGEKSALPLVQGRARGLDARALALEELVARSVIFARDAVQHADLASGVALLAVESWMARERALALAAAQGAELASAPQLNAAWKEVTALRVRELMSNLKLPAREAAAAIAQII